MRKVIYRVALTVFILLFAVSGFFIGKYIYNSKKAESVYNDFSSALLERIAVYETEQINRQLAPTANNSRDINAAANANTQGETTETAAASISADPRLLAYRDMNKIYPDLIGSINIPGTVVNYPVMYTPDDPEYYLDHDIEKGRSNHGTPFLDYKCDPGQPSDNMILYGHHMKDGSMFACLDQYKDKAFYEAHSIIEFDTLYDIGYYEVVAAFVSHIGSNGKYAFEYFLYTDFNDQIRFEEYMSLVRQYRLHDAGAEAVYGDKLLSLSTCDYTGANSRMVLLARKIQAP